MEITATVMNVNLLKIGFDFGINAKRRSVSPYADGVTMPKMQTFGSPSHNTTGAATVIFSQNFIGDRPRERSSSAKLAGSNSSI